MQDALSTHVAAEQGYFHDLLYWHQGARYYVRKARVLQEEFLDCADPGHSMKQGIGHQP
jgi:hypothetical protein